MKKRIFISCLIGVVIISGLYLFAREPFDRFNPWIEQQYVYVEVQEQPVDDDGRYKYKEQGVTESGETKRVVFSTSTRLEQGTFLKVLAKGTYTENYEFIDEGEIPSK
ncbi:YxeA family protein [Paenibacillus sp. MER 99-2]|uniref:YxeA family protein n=1 Tax=Paenibacillus sp. MER 99-2 TaxID=2939572 RepID=UPI00203AC449|nr:YxeA family protein [Paenibacillus sp. MER 99-2]MCM3170776.1 YxeA family protein [Paenibacillus sp. MER 99-2]